MATVVFAAAIQRHVACPPQDVSAANVRAAIDAALEDKNELRGYILDDQGRLRKHVAIFVDGNMIRDRAELSDLVHLHSEVFVVQALSGG